MTKTTTVYGWSTDSDPSVGIYDTICCLSSMSYLHEYCMCANTNGHANINVPHNGKGTQHTSQ